MGKRKHTLDSVKKHFEEQGCKLLATIYQNPRIKMEYICKCGNKSEIVYDKFKLGRRCQKCAGNEKLTFEFVQKYFKEQECELLETEYINSGELMKYRCKCGNESRIVWDSFKQGHRCKKCAGLEKLTIEFVKKEFKKQGCQLLETEYKNSGELMKYLCKCGNESRIIWDSFKTGRRCRQCGFDKSDKSGKTHKDYILPSGKIIRIQGYENIALDELIKVYKEDDIITNKREMPKINYNFEDKQKRYYPDIWIKSINKIIEIKSTWTYKRDLDKNKLKEIATKKLNFDFEFWVYKPISRVKHKETFSKEIVVN